MTTDTTALPFLIAQRIAKHIHGHQASKEAFVASVYGEWGVGKTHCLKAIQELFKASYPWQGNPPINLAPPLQTPDTKTLAIPVFFSPWQYEKEEHLIVPLLKTIEIALEDVISSGQVDKPLAEKTKKLLKALTHVVSKKVAEHSSKIGTVLSGLATYAIGVPLPKVVTDILDTAIKKGAETVQETTEEKQVEPPSDSDYYNFHAKLKEILAQSWKIKKDWDAYEPPAVLRFVLLIDDLDRCLPEKSIEMLESIKLFLNVEGFSFVLAVDDDIVERGIRHRYAAYVQTPETTTQNPTAPRVASQLPITGHEYLEKIVHLPQNLSRWDQAQAKKLFLNTLRGSEEPKMLLDQDNETALTDLVVRVVPLVPRKLIRLAESLQFQYASLKASRTQEEIEWNVLTATRTTLIAQLYPEVYRELRQGSSYYFWILLFSTVRAPNGQLAFSKELEKSRLAASGKEPNTTEQAEGVEDPSSRQNPKDEDLASIKADQSSDVENSPSGLITMDELERDEHQVFWKTYGLNPKRVRAFCEKVQTAIHSRNGEGLLDLWTDTQRQVVLKVKGDAVAQWGEITQTENFPVYNNTYLYLRDVKAKTPVREVAQEKEPAVEATAIEAGAIPSAEVGISEPSVLPVANVDAWIDAIVSDTDLKQALYLENNQRNGESADDVAFNQLLVRFLSMDMNARGQWRDAGRLTSARPLMGQEQMKYLASLIAPETWFTSKEGRFKLSAKGQTVIDTRTKLEWQRMPLGMQWKNGKVTGQSNQFTFDQAQKVAEKQGKEGWRLPTREELQSLVDYQQRNPAIDTRFFADTPSSWFWTSSPVVGLGSRAWVVGFGDGIVGRSARGFDLRVRLVRAGGVSD